MFVAVIAVYALCLRGDFLWDDDLHVTANPVIIGPLGLKEIWTTSAANYFPLVLTNFWVQHALWGLNPFGYHVVTVLCHALAAVLLWRVLVQLRVPGAWLGAALWALHPVQVESVAWICELKNTQSAVFFLAAIIFWLRWLGSAGGLPAVASREGWVPPASQGGRRDACATFLCALFAILSKPSTVMLPIALALCAWWQCGRLERRTLRALVPFFALSAVAALWTIWEQKFHSGAQGAEWDQGFLERVLIAGRVVWFYLGKLLWPGSLAFIYPRWSDLAHEPFAYLAALAALGGLAWLWIRRDRRRALFLAGAYFVALLFPVLGFFDVYFFRYSFVGDHFQYLASMGPLALLAAGLTRLGPSAGHIAAALLVPLAALTAVQSLDYRSSEKLWRATVARNPGSAMAWAQLGAVHVAAARHDEAIACFQRALHLNPKHPEALNHLGCEYLRTGRTAEAIVELQRALDARPGFPEAHRNLGLALAQDGRMNEALPHYEAALRSRPGDAGVHENIADALRQLGRLPDAIARYEAALRHQPGRASAHNSLGATLAQLGRMPDALAHFDEAARLEPAYAPAHINRGGALATLGRLPDAADAFARAVQLQPDSAKAHAYLAQVLRALGRENDAREHFALAERLEQVAPR